MMKTLACTFFMPRFILVAFSVGLTPALCLAQPSGGTSSTPQRSYTPPPPAPAPSSNYSADFQRKLDQQHERNAEAAARLAAMRADAQAKAAALNQGNANNSSRSGRGTAYDPNALHPTEPNGNGSLAIHTGEYGTSGGGSDGMRDYARNNGRDGGRNGGRDSAREAADAQAAEQEKWRQKSNSMMDAFKTGLTPANASAAANITSTGASGLLQAPPAPWGFGPGRLDVSPQQAGMPPQPDGATFVTDDGQVRSVGATGGTQAYVNNYITTRELAGNPLPGDFFDRDPAVVSYDSLGNPIDRDGFVVEYQSAAERQAAIIEQRQAAVEAAQQDAEVKRWADSLTLGDPNLSAAGFSDSPKTLSESFKQLGEAYKKWEAQDKEYEAERWQSMDKAMKEAAPLIKEIMKR